MLVTIYEMFIKLLKKAQFCLVRQTRPQVQDREGFKLILCNLKTFWFVGPALCIYRFPSLNMNHFAICSYTLTLKYHLIFLAAGTPSEIGYWRSLRDDRIKSRKSLALARVLCISALICGHRLI